MIYRWDIRYSIAKLFADSALSINFSKLVVTGKENIPDDVPLIFAPNHRNALIDALLIVKANPHSRQVVFLGRGDIFNNQLIAWILRGMRIIPVYRIRDGKDNLGKNEEIFDVAGRVLKNNNPIGIFPEANHNPKQSLLPIKKAVPRIVLPTEAQLNFELNSHIIPVSIYYTNVHDFLSECFVHFGKPISVSKYKTVYYNNPNLATNQLRGELEEDLRNIVVDIWNDEYYDEYKYLVDWNSRSLSKYHNDSTYLAAKYIVEHMNYMYHENRNDFDNKIIDIREAKSMLGEFDITDCWSRKPVKSNASIVIKKLLLLLSIPLALFGFANCVFPILIEKKLRSLFKDKQFISSARYVAGLILVPIFTIIQSLFIQMLFRDWLITLGYAFAMPSSFVFAIYWRKWKKSVNRQWRINRFSIKHPDAWTKLMSLSKL